MKPNPLTTLFSACLGLLVGTAVASAQLPSGWKAHDRNRPAPPVVTPGEKLGDAPSDATVLFNGKDLSGWTDHAGNPSKWDVVDGVLQSVQGAGPIFTEQKFGDCQLHVEFATPTNVKGNDQGRGNSGVFLMENFEIQVLDSFENSTYPDGSAGSIYGQYPPLVNACRGPGKWQSYDIIFHRPRFDDSGTLTRPATLTVLHNGVLIQDHAQAFGPTSWIRHGEYRPGESAKRLSFQDHGNPVRFRNIWIRSLEDPTPRDASNDRDVVELSDQQLAKLAGKYGGLNVKFNDGKTFIRFAGIDLEMVPHSETEFSLKKTAGSVTFQLDENGQPTECKLKLDAAGERSGKRESESSDG